MDNQEKFLLREVALADLPSSKRLDALDRLAATEGIYFSRRYPDPGGAHIKPPERSRKFIVTGLRRLLKTKRPLMGTTKAAILSRLLILRTGQDVMDEHNRQYLKVPVPVPDAASQQPEHASPVVAEIEAALAKYRGETNGHGQDAN
jgi:hypothetical protein